MGSLHVIVLCMGGMIIATGSFALGMFIGARMAATLLGHREDILTPEKIEIAQEDTE